MFRKTPFAFLLLLCASIAYADSSDRFVQKFSLTSKQTAVVAEGDLEARSIGSYSVRIYSTEGAQAGDDTTFFTSGIIRPRDGTIEKIRLAKLSNDSQPSLVVTIRSVGSGSYLSADAYDIRKDSIVLRTSVADLPKDADVIASLKSSLQQPKKK